MIARNVTFKGRPLYRVGPPEDHAFLQPHHHQFYEINANDSAYLGDLGYVTVANLRSFCLTFVMMRAGLQIDAKKLARHRRAIFRLGIIPGSVECIVVAIAAWNLIDVDINETTVKPLPFIYCLMTGWVERLSMSYRATGLIFFLKVSEFKFMNDKVLRILANYQAYI